jgi:hypothetical protein
MVTLTHQTTAAVLQVHSAVARLITYTSWRPFHKAPFAVPNRYTGGGVLLVNLTFQVDTGTAAGVHTNVLSIGSAANAATLDAVGSAGNAINNADTDSAQVCRMRACTLLEA